METTTRAKLSLMMFLEYLIWGAWYVTMGTYLSKTLQFDAVEIGLAYGAVSVAAMVSPFFVGMVADRFFPSERVLGVLHLLGGALLFTVAQLDSFSFFYIVLLGYTLCFMPTIALTNSLAFSQMKKPDKEFPLVRVFGTIGWIVIGLFLGFLKLEASSYTFYIAASASVALGLFSFVLPHTPPKEKGKKVSMADVLGLDALVLFKDTSFSVFFIASLLICIPLSFYYNFTNLFLNEVGMEGAAGKMTIGQISETLFLLVMPFFFVKLGVKRMLVVAMVAWAARYLLFAYGNSTTLVSFLYAGIFLHGICYDFFFVTGQIYVDQRAGEKVKSAAQGLITFATYGLGMFIGSYVSGQVVESYLLEQPADGISYQWESIWWVPALLSLGVLLFFLLFFKEQKAKTQQKEVVA